MKKVEYNCGCGGNTFDLILIEKGDQIFVRDSDGRLYEFTVDNPYDYSPIPEACPECNLCPSDDFIEGVLDDNTDL